MPFSVKKWQEEKKLCFFGFEAEFIYFCFVSTSFAIKNELPLLFSPKFLPSLPSANLPLFFLFSYHNVQRKKNIVGRHKTRQTKKSGRRTNRKEKMFYLFFHIFSSFNLCLRAFSGCFFAFSRTSEHINFVFFPFNPRKFFKGLNAPIFTCFNLMRILFRFYFATFLSRTINSQSHQPDFLMEQFLTFFWWRKW